MSHEGRRIRVLTFSTLFPSSARPGHGIFVETRLRELLKSGAVDARVVAPVPWFPSTNPRWGDYARYARTPAREQRNGIDVQHPRYVLPPKVGMTLAPLAMALGARPALQRLIDEGFDFDVIDAHYYYPDGVAAALLARHFRKPLTITARGSDLNLIPRYALPRRMMQWAGSKAAASIGVSTALVDVLNGWGLAAERLHVMRNGVDLERFKAIPQGEARARIGHEGAPLLISVGNLIELKGHHLAIEALAILRGQHPDARLLIVGEGPMRGALQEAARAFGVADRVVLAGVVPNEQLAAWYSAADALVLASSREGWPNVLLEAMACGTPVVSMRVGGTPEIVGPGSRGRLVDPGSRNGPALAAAIADLLQAGVERGRVRAYAEGFSWQSTTDAQLTLFERLAGSQEACIHA
jgi:glycosyltransferase involved in cell wall biosynthesis